MDVMEVVIVRVEEDDCVWQWSYRSIDVDRDSVRNYATTTTLTERRWN